MAKCNQLASLPYKGLYAQSAAAAAAGFVCTFAQICFVHASHFTECWRAVYYVRVRHESLDSSWPSCSYFRSVGQFIDNRRLNILCEMRSWLHVTKAVRSVHRLHLFPTRKPQTVAEFERATFTHRDVTGTLKRRTWNCRTWNVGLN